MCASLTPAQWIAEMTAAIRDRVDQLDMQAVNEYVDQSNEPSHNELMNDSDDDGYFDTKEEDHMIQYSESIKQINDRSNNQSKSQSRRLSLVAMCATTDSKLATIDQPINQSINQLNDSPAMQDMRQSIHQSLEVIRASDQLIEQTINELNMPIPLSLDPCDVSLKARSLIDASFSQLLEHVSNSESATQSSHQSNNQTINQTINLSNEEKQSVRAHLIDQSIKESIDGSFKQSIDQLMYESLNPSHDPLINQSINQTINQLLVHSIEQSAHRSMYQTFDQSFEQSTKKTVKRSSKKSNSQSSNRSIRCSKFVVPNDDDFYDCDDCCCELCSYFVGDETIKRAINKTIQKLRPLVENQSINQTIV